LDEFVGGFIFFNVLAIANAGFIAAIKACIFANVAAGKIFDCLFNVGNVLNGNNEDISNEFIFILNRSCERAGILFKFCRFCNKGKLDANGNVVGVVVDFKFKDGLTVNGILLFNDELNLFKFEANVEFVAVSVVFRGKEVVNGNIGGTENDNGTEVEDVFFVGVEEADVSLLLFEVLLVLLSLFMDGGISDTGVAFLLFSLLIFNSL
jgi:hypothetical protein